MDEQKTPDTMTTEEMLAQQLEFQKKQYRLSRITAVCAIAVLVITIGTAILVGTKVNDLYSASMVTLGNLEKITTELTATDFQSLMRDVESAVKTSEQAMEQVNSIDIDSLNASIRSLRDAVEPLETFFNVLGRR